ncbi:hypothetical protein MJN85_30300, partial [Salmonella enterica subsp. enterica serovar Anatum]|nr:hypothetical protein [Salmonella enterica subsp. enterica serovar Anatum]
MRKIIHVDMDCFFAAVEMRDNPALRDIPIAIGGRRERRGVVVNAKRQLGLVPQEFKFNPFETVQQIVVNQAGYYGVENKEAV